MVCVFIPSPVRMGTLLMEEDNVCCGIHNVVYNMEDDNLCCGIHNVEDNVCFCFGSTEFKFKSHVFGSGLTEFKFENWVSGSGLTEFKFQTSVSGSG